MHKRTWKALWKQLTASDASAGQPRRTAASRYFRPRLESLEQRLVFSSVSLTQNPLDCGCGTSTQSAIVSTPVASTPAASAGPIAAALAASSTAIVDVTCSDAGVTVVVQVNGTAPTGTVTVDFYDANFVLFASGSGALNGSGQASVTQSLTTGSYFLIATYSGDANNDPSSTNPITIEFEQQCTGGGVGILLLNKCGTSLSALSSGNVTVTGGDIFANSKGPTTAVIKGNGNVTANEIDVHGLYDAPGGGTAVGTIDMDDPPMADPLASLAIPAMGVTRSTSTRYISSGNVTLQPGRYIGGIVISGNANVTLAPGIYYLDGGGFTVTGKANVTGDGVMLYNAAKKTWCGYTGGDITFSTSGTVRLTAMSSGPYQGIVIFQDRRLTNTVTQSGSGSVFLTGKLYAAAATVKVNGNGDLVLRSDASKGITAQLVASKLVVTNMSTYSKCYRKVTPSTGSVLVDLGGTGTCTCSVRIGPE